MKNKFFIFIEAVYIIIVYALLAVGCFCLFAIDIYNDGGLVDFIIIAIFMFFLPIFLCLWSIIFMSPEIEVTEMGLKKRLLGKEIKFIAWEEMSCIQLKISGGGLAQWIFFSKSDISEYGIERSRLKKDNIYFYLTKSKIDIIMKYAPQDIKEKVLIEMKEKTNGF